MGIEVELQLQVRFWKNCYMYFDNMMIYKYINKYEMKLKLQPNSWQFGRSDIFSGSCFMLGTI